MGTMSKLHSFPIVEADGISIGSGWCHQFLVSGFPLCFWNLATEFGIALQSISADTTH